MTMVIVSGGIDLSVGSVVALSTVVTALLLRAGVSPAGRGARRRRRRRGLRRWSTACSSPRLRVVPFIVTLGTMLLVRGAAKGLADERRIEAPIDLAERSAAHRRATAAACSCRRASGCRGARAARRRGTLRYTRFGRHLFAIGSNERTARLCGVPVERAQDRGLHARGRAGRRRRRAAVLAAVGRRSDRRGRLRARRHRRGDHRRRQPRRRQGHGRSARSLGAAS